MKKREQRATTEPLPEDARESRREFLRKAGKMAVYTPPAMMMLMKPTQASILKSNGNSLPPISDIDDLFD